MSRTAFLIALLLVLGIPSGVVVAQQQANAAFMDGIVAFREHRYADAATAFKQAATEDPQNAQAYYLLSRVYFETDLRDVREARRALDKALELDPENVQFLVARLEQLRVESWNFFTERARELKRKEIAQQLLELDPTNAYAHEELGVSYIRDFWRYRNAVMFPTLQFLEFESRGPYSPATEEFTDPANIDAQVNQDQFVDPQDELGNVLERLNPNSVFMADEFDLDQLDQQGVPVRDFSARAQGAYDRAIGHLEQALETNPRHRSIYDHMMQIYALKGEYEAALEMLDQMYVFYPEEPALWTYLGMTHFRAGNLEASNKSFETAFEFMPPEQSAAFLSLDFILPEDEKKAYEAEPIAYASRYWTSQDPRYLTTFNERKLEHYSRLIYADLLYGAPDIGLRGWETQRGRILVRYGAPKADVVIVPRSTSGIERSGFAQETASVQERSAGSLFEDFDMADEANTFNVWIYDDFQFVFEDPFRTGEFRLYSPSASDIANGAIPWVNDYTIKAAETFREVPEQYDYEAPGRQIEVPYLVTSFKGEGGNTQVYVNYGIPITEYDRSQDLLNITANAGTFLVSDKREMLVERRRTIYGLQTSQIAEFDGTNLWVDTQVMSAPPGTHDLSVEFETASGGTVAVQRREVTVPNFDVQELAVSDVMLAYNIEEVYEDEKPKGSNIIRSGLTITPAPWSVFSPERPIYIYFEMYNLEKGADGQTRYEVEAILSPKENDRGVRGLLNRLGNRKRGVSVSLPPGSSSEADENQYLVLDANSMETGLYTLTLEVRDLISGKTVDTSQDLFLE